MANPPNKIRWAVFAVIALFALCVRLPQLGSRPMHTDETVNAYLVGQLLAGKGYHYDPVDRHGPVLSEVALPLARLQGAHSLAELTEPELRLAPVLAGSLMILLFGFGVEVFGFRVCVVAALLFAFAALSLYYSRYFIHETFFVAATLGLLLSLVRPRSWRTAVGAGFCAAFMVACKETSVIHLTAVAVAYLATGLWWEKPKDFKPDAPSEPKRMSLGKFWLAAGVVLLLAGLLLFTWFGRDLAALTALFHAGPHLTARAGGQGHEKPFWYFVWLLTNGAGEVIVSGLACVGLLVALVGRGTSRPWAFLAVYGAIILLAYSAIPYKTPWLALNLWLPLVFFAACGGVWLASLFTGTGGRTFFFLILAVGGWLLGRETLTRVFRDPVGERNPYAYAHTIDDLLGLPERIAQVAQAKKLTSPRIAVVAADGWPLPWYLRKFPQTGFWQPGEDPGTADFYVTLPEPPDNLSARLGSCQAEFFGVRPNVLLILWTPKDSPSPVNP